MYELIVDKIIPLCNNVPTVNKQKVNYYEKLKKARISKDWNG